MSMFDLVVAAVLTTTLIGTLTTSTVRSMRLMKDTRDQQLALEELSNQLERLMALDEVTRNEEINALMPSNEVARALEDATLKADLIEDEQGQRLIVSLNWNRGADANPKQLVGWIKPSLQDSTP